MSATIALGGGIAAGALGMVGAAGGVRGPGGLREAGGARGIGWGSGRVLDFRRRGAPPRRRRRSPLLALARPLLTAVLAVALPVALGAWMMTSSRFQLRHIVVVGGLPARAAAAPARPAASARAAARSAASARAAVAPAAASARAAALAPPLVASDHAPASARAAVLARAAASARSAAWAPPAVLERLASLGSWARRVSLDAWERLANLASPAGPAKVHRAARLASAGSAVRRTHPASPSPVTSPPPVTSLPLATPPPLATAPPSVAHVTTAGGAPRPAIPPALQPAHPARAVPAAPAAAAGVERVPATWVRRALAPLLGRNLLRLPLDEVQTLLAANPWVASADVAKELPDGLRVTIAERRPAVLLRRGAALLYADAAGRPIASVASPEEAAAARRQGLLVVSFPPPLAQPAGPPEPAAPAAVDGGVAGALRLAARLRQLRPAWAASLAQIDVVDEDDYQLHVEGLPCPLLVRGSRLAGNLTRFEQLLPELRRRYPALAAVDLRSARRIVVQPAPARPAAPAAASRGQSNL